MRMCVGVSHTWSAPPDSRNRDVTRIRATAAQVRDAAGIRSRGVCQTGNGMACFQALQPTPLGVRPQQRVPRGDAPPQLTFLSEESPKSFLIGWSMKEANDEEAPPIPPAHERRGDIPSYEELNFCLNTLKARKATGHDRARSHRGI